MNTTCTCTVFGKSGLLHSDHCPKRQAYERVKKMLENLFESQPVNKDQLAMMIEKLSPSGMVNKEGIARMVANLPPSQPVKKENNTTDETRVAKHQRMKKLGENLARHKPVAHELNIEEYLKECADNGIEPVIDLVEGELD